MISSTSWSRWRPNVSAAPMIWRRARGNVERGPVRGLHPVLVDLDVLHERARTSLGSRRPVRAATHPSSACRIQSPRDDARPPTSAPARSGSLMSGPRAPAEPDSTARRLPPMSNGIRACTGRRSQEERFVDQARIRPWCCHDLPGNNRVTTWAAVSTSRPTRSARRGRHGPSSPTSAGVGPARAG